MNAVLPLNNKKDAFNCRCGSVLLFMSLTGFHNVSCLPSLIPSYVNLKFKNRKHDHWCNLGSG